MRISENQVKIEGILSEVGLETATFNRKGQTTECIRGTIKIRVEQDINGTMTTMEVPVSAFASRYTNAGAENPLQPVVILTMLTVSVLRTVLFRRMYSMLRMATL